MSLRSLLGFPVELSNALLFKQNTNTTIKPTHTGDLLASIQTGCLVALHVKQSLTVLNSCGMLVFNRECYLD